MNVQLTPQQQMALAFRGFPTPEITTRQVVFPAIVNPQTQEVVAPAKVVDRYLAYTVREDGNWVEALGRDPLDAINNLVREVIR